MNLTFVFWITAFYTIVLFGLQIYELLTGRAPFNFAAINAGYLGLMSVYVGGKEVNRWVKPVSPTDPTGQTDSTSFRLPGEWFVGGWVTLFLTSSLLVQFWPGRFTYPTGLNTIALEVLGFYLSTSVSRWLRVRDNETQVQLENKLTHASTDSTAASLDVERRITKKRQRYEAKILETVRKKGNITREEVQKLTGLKESAAGRLLAGMVERGLLRRRGAVGSTEARYEPGDQTLTAPES